MRAPSSTLQDLACKAARLRAITIARDPHCCGPLVIRTGLTGYDPATRAMTAEANWICSACGRVVDKPYSATIRP